MWRFVLAAALAVTGCAAAQRAEFSKAVAECKAQFPAEIDQIVERARCVNAAADRIAPNDPIRPLANAVRLELAEKVKSGQMTHAEADAAFAREMFQAEQQLSQTRAANAAAAAAVLSTLPQYHSATCYGVAGYVNCNGY